MTGSLLHTWVHRSISGKGEDGMQAWNTTFLSIEWLFPLLKRMHIAARAWTFAKYYFLKCLHWRIPKSIFAGKSHEKYLYYHITSFLLICWPLLLEFYNGYFLWIYPFPLLILIFHKHTFHSTLTPRGSLELQVAINELESYWKTESTIPLWVPAIHSDDSTL